MNCIRPSHFFKAALYSLAGMRHAFANEQAFKHEVLVLPVLAFVLWLTDISLGVSLLVLAGWLMVMAVELLNSAIEGAFNMISLERDPRIKAGKDMASAAIFLTIAANVGLWLWVWL